MRARAAPVPRSEPPARHRVGDASVPGYQSATWCRWSSSGSGSRCPANTPMVLLREQTGRHRLLPIYIGTPEATSIHYALEGVTPPRPLTHDLFVQTLDRARASARADRGHRDARPHVLRRAAPAPREGDVTVLSSRPSDAIALAVRVSAPLFASEELLDEVGQEPTAEPEEEAEEILDEFRDFIEHVNPDDFAMAAAEPGRPSPRLTPRCSGVVASACSHRRNYAGVARGRSWRVSRRGVGPWHRTSGSAGRRRRRSSASPTASSTTGPART